ncbi:hypothetical protein KC851_04635 [Candidatus Kaiserbacteria bacterium]|nr:hypothetical protein [Candidatus Kaiserbacteria bacterium]
MFWVWYGIAVGLLFINVNYFTEDHLSAIIICLVCAAIALHSLQIAIKRVLIDVKQGKYK